jgi:hypothetical protein
MDYRRNRGYLTMDINDLLKGVMTGEVQITEGTKLTPSVVAQLLVEIEGLEAEDKPSTGAVTAIFKNMEKVGYATFTKPPYAFEDFTEEGKVMGYEGMLDAWNKLHPPSSREKYVPLTSRPRKLPPEPLVIPPDVPLLDIL